MIGWTEILVIGLIAFLLFGGAMLPKIAKSVGKSLKEFKDAVKDGTEDKEQDKEIDKEKK